MKNRWMKKCILLLLSLCLMLGCLSMTVQAASGPSVTVEYNIPFTFILYSDLDGVANKYTYTEQNGWRGRTPEYDDLVEILFSIGSDRYIKSLTHNGTNMMITDASNTSGYEYHTRFYLEGDTTIQFLLGYYQDVYFDPNTGSGTMAEQKFKGDVPQALSANAFTKRGFVFTGWNDRPDGSGDAYTDEEVITFTEEEAGPFDYILYAQWTPCTDHVMEDGQCEKCGITTYPVEEPAPLNTIVYGQKLSQVALPSGWSWAEPEQYPKVSNTGFLAYHYPPEPEGYDWTGVEGWNAEQLRIERTIPVTVLPKELTIQWGETHFIYDGSEKFPEFTVSGVITGDAVQFSRSGAAILPGEGYSAKITGITGADAGNYKLPENTSVLFTIEPKTYEIDLPEEPLTGGTLASDKTGAKAGETVAVTAAPEEGYRLEKIRILTRGGSLVAESDQEEMTFTMPENDVVIEAAFQLKEYTVQVPATQKGYRLETDVTRIPHGGEVYISCVVKKGYEKTADFAVKVNGVPVELTEYDNAVVIATEDLVITVEGVARKASATTDVPDTRDNSNLWLWGMLLALSAAGIVTAVLLAQKKRKAK